MHSSLFFNYVNETTVHLQGITLSAEKEKGS